MSALPSPLNICKSDLPTVFFFTAFVNMFFSLCLVANIAVK